MARPEQPATRVQSVVGVIAVTLLFAAVTSFAVVVSQQQATELLGPHEQVIDVPQRLPGYAAQEEAELDNEEIAAAQLMRRKAAGSIPSQFAQANEVEVQKALVDHGVAHLPVSTARKQFNKFNKVTGVDITAAKVASLQGELQASQALAPQFHPYESTEKGVRGAAEHRLQVKTAVATAQGAVATALQSKTAVAEKAVRKQLLTVSIPASQRLAKADPRRPAEPMAVAPATQTALDIVSPAVVPAEAAEAESTEASVGVPKQAPADAGQGKLEAKGVDVKGTTWNLLGNWQGVGSLDDHPADVEVPIADAKVGEPLVGEPLLEAEQEEEGGTRAQASAVAGSQRLASAPHTHAAQPGAHLLAGAKGMDTFVKVRAVAPAAAAAVDHSRALELRSPALALHTLRDKVRADSPQAQEPLFERIF